MFLACDLTAAFFGELNGKPIATVRISKYGDSFAFIVAYLVDKEYIGKGYGLKIFDAAVSSVKPTSNTGLYALLHLKKMYKKRRIPKSLLCGAEISSRPTFFKEKGYVIGPLLADSKAIVEKLLKALFEKLLHREKAALLVRMDASTKQGMELGEELQRKKGFDFVYVVTKDLPNTCLEKQSGVTNTDLE